MKRLLLALAVTAVLVLPAAALAKGPSEASLTGPGLDKAITITGPEEEGSPLMEFAELAGFFPAAFGQQPNPMLPGRPKGDLGPRYTIDYTVPGGNNDTFRISQEVYPNANPPVTYMKPGQEIFDMTTPGGWYPATSQLKRVLVEAGLPTSAAASAPREAESSSAGFLSTGRLGALLVVLLVLGAATMLMRRRFHHHPAA